MYIPYLKAIKTLFKDHLNEFKTVDWYKNFFESGSKPSTGGFEPPENVMTIKC